MNKFSTAPVALLVIYCALLLLALLPGGWVLLALRLTHAPLASILPFSRILHSAIESRRLLRGKRHL